MIHCDVKKCVGCKSCEVACSTFHYGAVLPAMSRIRIAKLEEIGIDFAVSCLSCIEKPCLECPTDSLSTGENGEIIHDPEFCDACFLCVENCPVGAVGIYEEKPLFCDLCDGEMSCIGECPSDALSFVENEEVSLKEFLQNEGNPAQRRAQFAKRQSQKLREFWISGGRVDS